MIGLLIVDDEEGVRRSLKKALAGDGYDICLAARGEEALDIVRAGGRDIGIVIADFKMPGMDGLETLTAVAKINPEITRIILTGYASMERAIDSVNAGIDGFLTKPFVNLELRAKVRECNIRKRLKQFVSEKILMEMVRSGKTIEPRYQKASVVFVDIRGFSRFSKKMRPQEVSRLLSSNFFHPLDNIIHEHNGTLDKHIGDGIMGVFGAPVPGEDDAARAVLSAVRMREEMAAINRSLSEKDRHIAIGIGISTGEVLAGVFGSNRKKEYTVYGETVNLAARLERLARPDEILVCQDTFGETRDMVRTERVGRLHIAGIENEMDIYRVTGRSATPQLGFFNSLLENN